MELEMSYPNLELMNRMAEGFGLNSNIFETNILNLSVVITVVVSLGGDAIKTLLADRKEKILANLKEADQKAAEAALKLQEVQLKRAEAQTKANEIDKQGQLTATQERTLISEQTQTLIQRLYDLKQEAVSFQEQKLIKAISRYVIKLAFKKVHDFLEVKARDQSKFPVAITNYNLTRFKAYKPVLSLN